ncbi:hypothetical protein ACFVYR_19870 [Streptomyces sp. NPDC058284]|uniref:hypothetical protein n=1 Tax=unclassified Streptomyces TaxID=2593676 RepID=UPI003658EC73
MREKPDYGKESKDQEESSEKRRLDLSLPQVAGSAMAAVVAAKLASNLGVYGTILGAGVVSAIATCGGTVFQHFFKRTGEQIRDVTVQAKPKARQVPVRAATQVPETFRAHAYTGATGATGPVTTTWGRPQPADPGADAAETRLLPAPPLPTTEDADPTTVLPAAGTDPTTVPPPAGDEGATTVLPSAAPGADAEQTQLLGTVDATRAQARDDATRVLRAANPAPGPDPAPTTAFEPPHPPPHPSDEFTEGTTHRAQIRSWKRPLIAAAVVFGVSMAGITTYELVSGKDLSGGDGTTIGNGVSGHNSSRNKPSEPADEPSVQPSEHGTPGTGDGSGQGDGDATQDPDGTGRTPGNGTGNGTGDGSGSQDDPGKGTGNDPDKDQDNGSSGDDGSKTDPTPTPPPTPTPTPSGDTGSGPGDGAKPGGTPTP